MNSFLEAQKDMRTAYYFGIPGVVSSASVWITAGIVATIVSTKTGIITLVIGGMFIFPISILLGKIIGISGKHNKDNPLSSLAMEGTVWMLVSIPIAIAVAFYKMEWFFPSMILIIGGRYLTFKTLYGLRAYWMLGIALVITAIILVVLSAPANIGAFAGGLVELLFACVIFASNRKQANKLV